MISTYNIIKSLHLIGVIAWFAGLFYIFRLFVYHTENQDSEKIKSLLCTMERRLYFGITWPAMIWTLVMGIIMIFMNSDLLKTGWFHAKLAFLFVLIFYHLFSGYTRKRFSKDDFFLTSKQCRLINEVPTIILVVVVPLAFLKPF